MSKEVVTKLAIDRDGMLKETGEKKVVVDAAHVLQEINYIPAENEIVLQQLPMAESKTAGGIIIPGYVKSKNEFKLAVVAVATNGKYKRGDIVRLDPNYFAVKDNATGNVRFNIPNEYIDDKLLMQVPEHFIKGIYTNINLADWK